MEFSLAHFKFTLHSGALIPLLVMLPNLAWMLLPKKAAPRPGREPLLLTILENIGRVAVLVLPFFSDLELGRKFSLPVLIGMGLALAAYYACWIRYFKAGASPELMSQPFLGIPLPLAVTPVVFLLLSAYLLHSWWMLTAAGVFGVAHIWVSSLTL